MQTYLDALELAFKEFSSDLDDEQRPKSDPARWYCFALVLKAVES
jgi:hypothetical protein